MPYQSFQGYTPGTVNVGLSGDLQATSSKIHYYLHSDATYSVWNPVYQRVAFFMMDIVHKQPDRAAFWGQTVEFKLPELDLIWFAYLGIKLRGIYGIAESNGVGPCGIGARYAHGASLPGFSNTRRYVDNADDALMLQHSKANGICGLNDAREAKKYYLWDTRNRAYCDGLDDQLSYAPSDLPDDSHPFAFWVNAPAFAAIKHAEFTVGNHKVDELWGQLLFAMEELQGKPGNRLKELIGKRCHEDELILDSREDRWVYAPLWFFFTQSTSHVFKRFFVTAAESVIRITFNDLEHMIVKNHMNTTLLTVENDEKLNRNHLDCYILFGGAMILEPEKNRYLQAADEVGHFDDIVVVNQRRQDVFQHKDEIEMKCNFSNGVFELIWMLQRESLRSQNYHFNFSGIDGKDPITSAELLYGNAVRVPKTDAKVFRLIYPHMFHSVCPKYHIYCWTISVNPESPQWSGAIAWHMIRDAMLKLTLQPALSCEKITVTVFSRAYMALRYKNFVVQPQSF